MQLAPQNLHRASLLAASLDRIEQRSVGDRSVCWIGQYDGQDGDTSQRIALWANRPESQGGAIGIHLGQELPSFLEDAQAAGVERIVLFLDSAGVSMYESWRGMQYCADVVKALHKINQRNDIVTIAVLGEEIGCYGGALLIAGACQYQLASLNGRYGVSGSRVIHQVTGQPHDSKHSYPPCYWATARLVNSELTGLLPDTVDALKDQLLSLSLEQTTLPSLRKRLDFLKQKSKEAMESIDDHIPAATGVTMAQNPAQDKPGFAGDTAVGCDALLAFCEYVLDELEAGRQLPVLAGDAVQEFSLANEIRGFSACLSLTAALLRYAAEQQPSLRVEVSEVGCGAAFIALSLMADDISIDESARIYSLPPAVIEAFTGTPLEEVVEGINWHEAEATA